MLGEVRHAKARRALLPAQEEMTAYLTFCY